jgi:hypothetical protein
MAVRGDMWCPSAGKLSGRLRGVLRVRRQCSMRTFTSAAPGTLDGQPDLAAAGLARQEVAIRRAHAPSGGVDKVEVGLRFSDWCSRR